MTCVEMLHEEHLAVTGGLNVSHDYHSTPSRKFALKLSKKSLDSLILYYEEDYRTFSYPLPKLEAGVYTCIKSIIDMENVSPAAE